MEYRFYPLHFIIPLDITSNNNNNNKFLYSHILVTSETPIEQHNIVN